MFRTRTRRRAALTLVTATTGLLTLLGACASPAPAETVTPTPVVTDTALPTPQTNQSLPRQDQAVPSDPRPNIVLISTDDQRADDMDWMPITRKLIGEAGATFTNGTAPHPQCCPARAMILSGQYAQNNGVEGNYGPHGGFPAMREHRTVGTWLHDAGYSTAYVGKFLNGYKGGMMPGWDIFNPTIKGLYSYYGFTMYNNGNPITYTDIHNADYVGLKTEEYIKQFAAADKPFFVWSSQVAPHESKTKGIARWQNPIPATRDLGRLSYAVAPALSEKTFNKAHTVDRNARVAKKHRLKRAEIAALNEARLESLQAVDAAVGRTIAALEETGELDNTIVAFITDNGFLLGEHRIIGKNVGYEEAVNIPFLMRGPGIAPGTVRDTQVGLLDLAPTFLEAAGAHADHALDGHSILDVARTGADLRRDTLLLQGGAGAGNKDQVGWLYRGVRTDRYTYVVYPETGETLLYDRLLDPTQKKNLSGKGRYADVEAELAKRVRKLGDCAGSSCRRHFGPVS